MGEKDCGFDDKTSFKNLYVHVKICLVQAVKCFCLLFRILCILIILNKLSHIDIDLRSISLGDISQIM